MAQLGGNDCIVVVVAVAALTSFSMNSPCSIFEAASIERDVYLNCSLILLKSDA